MKTWVWVQVHQLLLGELPNTRCCHRTQQPLQPALQHQLPPQSATICCHYHSIVGHIEEVLVMAMVRLQLLLHEQW